MPTFYDPSSKVVIESLMMGTPAISTAYNGASDFIAPADGSARGRVIADPSDHRALAQAMIELWDPAELEQLAGRPPSVWLSSYRCDGMWINWRKCCERVLLAAWAFRGAPRVNRSPMRGR